MSYLLRYLGTVNPMARQELEINMTSVTNKYKMWVQFLNDLPPHRVCHPLALASIFTRRIYSLPWCAPGQSQIWENNLFEFKLFNDDGYLVFNCKNWLEISIFVYFCRLGCIKHCERKGKVFACLDSIGWHGQCRKFAGICTLTSDGAFSKSPKTNKTTFFLWKWKLKKQKVGLPSYRRIQGWNSRAECLRRTTKERLGLSKRDTWKDLEH